MADQATANTREDLLSRPEVAEAVRASVDCAPPLSDDQVNVLRAAGLDEVFRAAASVKDVA